MDEIEEEEEAEELFAKVSKAAEQHLDKLHHAAHGVVSSVDIKMGECWLHRNQNKRCACCWIARMLMDCAHVTNSHTTVCICCHWVASTKYVPLPARLTCRFLCPKGTPDAEGSYIRGALECILQ